MKNDLDPKLIGNVVILQTLRRQGDDSKELVHESIEKFVGTLLGYSVSPTHNSFIFQGVSDPILVSKKTHFFELYMSDDTPSIRSSIANVSTRVIDDVILANQSDADKILTELRKIIDLHGSASMTDLYDLVGMSARFTDNKWGWKSLYSATIVNNAHGFQLNLPRPIQL
jgi:hypothetical protein